MTQPLDKLPTTSPSDLVRESTKPEILHPTTVIVPDVPQPDASLTLQEKIWYQGIPFIGKVVEILARNTIVGKVWELSRLIFPSLGEKPLTSGSTTMNNDLKATMTGLVTGILGLLAYFNIVIPQSFVEPIILVGVVIVGFLANRKDKVTPAG